MSLSHAWLDDVRPSSYADQLALGFRWLRFSPPLEREYRLALRDETYDLKRIALSVGMLIWLAFAAFDFVLIEAREVWWMLGIRLVVLLNDVSMRRFVVPEMQMGFGFINAKPATVFAPVYGPPFVRDLDGHKIEAAFWDLDQVYELYIEPHEH